MRSILLLLSILVFNTSYAQLQDIEIIHSLVSKHHANIRESMLDLGLSYVQKYQKIKKNGDAKYIFFVVGTEGNKKPWEIYTKQIDKDSLQIIRIIIKYYYNKPGDIIEFDMFKNFEPELINGHIVRYDKSVGKKQAHVEVTIREINEKADYIKTKFNNISTYSASPLFVQIVTESFKSDKKVYRINIFQKGVFYCIGSPENYLLIELFNNDTILLQHDFANYKCSNSAISTFEINQNEFSLLKNNLVKSIRISQKGHEKKYDKLISNSFMLLVEELKHNF